MTNLTPKQKNILTTIVIVILCVALLIVSIIEKKQALKNEQEISSKAVLVTDNSRYFTVINCINKYLNYVSLGNKDDIMILLSKEYKDSYQITKENLNNFIPKLSNETMNDYAGDEMYEKKISKNIVEYYVMGKIQTTNLDEPSTYTKYDVTVILYEDNLTFSIKPGVGDLDI